MKILFLAGRQDYGNGGYRLQKSLEKVGITSLAVQMKLHPYKYPEQAKICTYEEILTYVKETEIIIFMSSRYLDLGSLEGKRIFVFHRGWGYRSDPEHMNKFFNPIVEKSLVTTPDLLGLGAKNEIWVSFPIDTEVIQPIWTQNEKLIISHLPANKRKGTEVITHVFQKLEKEMGNKVEFEIGSLKSVHWTKNIERMSRCDIYVERCNISFLEKKTGAWGNTAVEAAALGKIVVASFLDRKRYEKEFGPCPIQDANSPEELEVVLRKLIQMDSMEREELKYKTVDWVKEFHSYEAIGQRLKRIIEE